MAGKLNPIGNRIIRLTSVNSTNDYARHLALQGMPEGCVVIAREQTKGKGRLNRNWDSPQDMGLWFSMILRPPLSARYASIIPFFTSVALVHSIRTHFSITPQLKWPNDILIEKKKIGGILSEVEFRRRLVNFIIVGIGINLYHSPADFPPALQSKAGSLRMFSPIPVDTETFFQTILTNLNHYYEKATRDGFENIFTEWKTYCPDFKKTIQLRQHSQIIQGIFYDLAPDGSLILQQGSEFNKLTSGDMDYHNEKDYEKKPQRKINNEKESQRKINNEKEPQRKINNEKESQRKI